MAGIKTEKESQGVSVILEKEAFYWTGALPAIGEVKWKVRSNDRASATNENGEFFNYIATNASNLWNSKHNDTQIWRGKCEWYQNIPVTGHAFPAFSDRVIRQGDSNEFAQVPWPGSIAKWTEEEFKHIVEQTYRHIIKIGTNGKGSLKNLDSMSHPPIDPNNDLTRPLITDFFKFNPRADSYVAKYVYIVKIADVDDLSADVKPAEYFKFCPMKVMDDLFIRPPKSVEEAFPMKDGKIQF